MSEPIIKMSDRALSIAVFEFQNQNGPNTYSVNIQRAFKKKDAQEWTREEIHCYEEDLLKIAHLCHEAYDALRKYRSPKPKAKEATQAPAQAPASQPEAQVDDEIPF